MSNTPNFNLNLISDGDTTWGDEARANYSILDATVGGVPPWRRRKGATEDRWYVAGMVNATVLTTGAPTANFLRALPLITGRATLDRIAINVTAAAAGSARLGIYNDGGNLYPSSLVLDAGEVSTGTTGVKALTIINQTLAPGLYWLVLVSNAASTIRALALGGCMAILGLDATLGTAPGVGWSATFTYAALPASFPAGASVLAATPVPAVFVRAAA